MEFTLHCSSESGHPRKTIRFLVEGGNNRCNLFIQAVLEDGSNFGLGPDAASKAPDRP
jgi:hypothetical protein